MGPWRQSGETVTSASNGPAEASYTMLTGRSQRPACAALAVSWSA